MVLKIDFDSEEALYTQLCNQIICGIAMDMLHAKKTYVQSLSSSASAHYW